MRIISYFILLVIMLIGLTFASLNSTPVTFNYYLGSKDIALSILLTLFFGAGIFLGMIAFIISWIKIKRGNLKLKSQLKVTEIEIKNLRSIPIKGE